MTGALVSTLVVLLFATPAANVSRAHFQRAQKLFAQERYKQALDEFTAASEKAPEEIPDLYFNIGQCHRNLGQTRQARLAFEHYLALRPDAPDRRQVLALVAMLGGRGKSDGSETPVEEPAASAPAEAPPVEPPSPLQPTPAPTVATASETPTVTPAPSAIVAAPPAPAPARRESRRRWPIWVGIAAGAAVSAVAIGVGVHYGTAASSGSPALMTPSGPPMLNSTVQFDTRGR